MAQRGDEGSESRGGERRSIVYCLIPAELAPKLHDLLREHFRDEPDVEVVVERRRRERRSGDDRRREEAKRPGDERRQIRNVGGRRIADRRAAQVPVEALPLPRRARRYAERLTFVERVVPSEEHLEDLDTARLVMRIQSGQREAFTDLYVRYFDRVYGYLRVALASSHAAEDATQQVFTQVLEALPDYERRRQPFRAWLFVIARNHVVRVLRKEGRVDLVDPAEIGEHVEHLEARPVREPELPVLEWISDRDLLLFIERMPPEQRQVLTLRYMMGLTMPEIARALDKSPAAIRRAHSRAIAFLRERLTAVGRDPKRRRGGRVGALAYRSQARVLRTRRFSLISSGPAR